LLFLPETLGYPLPDTLAAASLCEKGHTKNVWSWWNAERLQEEVQKQKERMEEVSNVKTIK